MPEPSQADPWAAHLPGQELVPAILFLDEVLVRVRTYAADRPRDVVDALTAAQV